MYDILVNFALTLVNAGFTRVSMEITTRGLAMVILILGPGRDNICATKSTTEWGGDKALDFLVPSLMSFATATKEEIHRIWLSFPCLKGFESLTS